MTEAQKNYRERQRELLFAVTGTRNVLELPLENFNDKTAISFLRVKGSVRLINGMVATQSEDEAFIEEGLSIVFP